MIGAHAPEGLGLGPIPESVAHADVAAVAAARRYEAGEIDLAAYIAALAALVDAWREHGHGVR